MKRTKITVRVATPTSSVTPCGRATFPASGEGKEAAGTPRTVKPGEKIVVEAMRAEGLERGAGKIAALECLVEVQQKEIEKQTAKFEELTMDYSTMYESWEETQSENKKLKMMLETKTRLVESFKKHTTFQAQTNHELTQEVERLKEENAAALHEIESLTIENKTLRYGIVPMPKEEGSCHE